MTNFVPSFTIQDKVRAALSAPEPSPVFIDRLEAQLLSPAGQGNLQKNRRPGWKDWVALRLRRPAWVTAILVILLLVAGLVVVGPQRVLAAFRQLFGYIPGVGLVDESAPIRVLAEPVSLTRDGVTVSVTSATLTTERTYLDFGAYGVSLAAYPKTEGGGGGCMEPAYLLLPDGTKILAANEMDKPIPADVKSGDSGDALYLQHPPRHGSHRLGAPLALYPRSAGYDDDPGDRDAAVAFAVPASRHARPPRKSPGDYQGSGYRRSLRDHG